MTIQPPKLKYIFHWIIFFAVLAAVGITWYYTGKILTWLGAPVETAERGQFGDMYGAINTLFSGLAFGFLIANTYMQSGQLRMQHEELALTRKEISAQLHQMKEQSSIFESQTNDSTFFKLIDLLDMHAKALILHTNPSEFKGADAMRFLSNQLRSIAPPLSDENSSNYLLLRHKTEALINKYHEIRTYTKIAHVLIEIASKHPEKYIPIFNALLSIEEKIIIAASLFTKKELEKIVHFVGSDYYDFPGDLYMSYEQANIAEEKHENKKKQ